MTATRPCGCSFDVDPSAPSCRSVASPITNPACMACRWHKSHRRPLSTATQRALLRHTSDLPEPCTYRRGRWNINRCGWTPIYPYWRPSLGIAHTSGQYLVVVAATSKCRVPETGKRRRGAEMVCNGEKPGHGPGTPPLEAINCDFSF